MFKQLKAATSRRLKLPSFANLIIAFWMNPEMGVIWATEGSSSFVVAISEQL